MFKGCAPLKYIHIDKFCAVKLDFFKPRAVEERFGVNNLRSERHGIQLRAPLKSVSVDIIHVFEIDFSDGGAGKRKVVDILHRRGQNHFLNNGIVPQRSPCDDFRAVPYRQRRLFAEIMHESRAGNLFGSRACTFVVQ